MQRKRNTPGAFTRITPYVAILEAALLGAGGGNHTCFSSEPDPNKATPK